MSLQRVKCWLGWHVWVYLLDRSKRRCLACDCAPQLAVFIERDGERRLLGYR